MGKRAAPKVEAGQAAKAKAKAKSSSTRSTSAKAQSMTEAELTEYRNLHSKLTYRSKVGMAGADEALHQLKCNRELVLEKFRGDKTMAWVPSMVHEQESAHVNKFDKTSEWLNEFQIMEKIGLTAEMVKANPIAADILKCTLETLPVRDHEIKALADKDMKQYEWSHEKSTESVLSKERLAVTATGSAASAPKAKAAALPGPGVGPGGAAISINYEVACKGFRGQMTKCIKDLEKWSSKLRKLRPQIANKDTDNKKISDDSKKCEQTIADCLDALTSALADHPAGGDEDIYKTFKTVLDAGLHMKTEAEKIESAAKQTVEDSKMDAELEDAVSKVQAHEKDLTDKKTADDPPNGGKVSEDDNSNANGNGNGNGNTVA